MKRILPFFALLIFLVSMPNNNTSAQCKGFAKKVCKSFLTPYIHDGNFDAAAIFTEGEEADFYKTFYAGQQYRLMICSTESLPPIEFKVVDANQKVLFNNREHNMAKFWDFKLQSSQQLRIIIKVSTAGQKKAENDISSGCVAILIGFKDQTTEAK